MLTNTPENRAEINRYLEQVSEDDFIDDFIIPFYSSHGYYLYRINSHGPGEHGKDLLFYRHVPIFFDNEYLAIQAKAESIGTGNVIKFKDQLFRAIGTPFNTKSGNGTQKPNYVVLINARRSTNDGDTEINRLIDGFPNIKVLTQENVCELILKTGIAPNSLLSRLAICEAAVSTRTDEDRLIIDILLKSQPANIDQLFDHQLALIKNSISIDVKEMAITYLFNLWENDRSWDGTIKPMKWLNKYFDLIQPRQFPLLINVLSELTSSTPSYRAQSDTYQVSNKITSVMMESSVTELLKLCARIFTDQKPYKNIPLNLLEELVQTGKVENTVELEVAKSILTVVQNGLSPAMVQEYNRIMKYVVYGN